MLTEMELTLNKPNKVLVMKSRVDPHEFEGTCKYGDGDRINNMKLIKKAMKGVMIKLILRECMEKARVESSLAKPKVDDNVKIELNKEHLMELRNNAYNGREEEYVDEEEGTDSLEFIIWLNDAVIVGLLHEVLQLPRQST
ncbi:hypothetical protein Tco_0452234 [Tanacetum coccineum]